MYVAVTSWQVLHTGFKANCDVAAYAPYRSDTSRVWVQSGLRFPGTGTQYPVPPGEARVYAADALDHRVASGSTLFPDLSTAAFEQVADDADTDNPLAGNMTPAFATTLGAGGRGLRPGGTGSWILIKSGPQSRFPTVTLDPYNVQDGAGVPFTPQTLWGIPREDIVDVYSIDMSADHKAFLATTTYRYTMCLPWLPPVFERAAAEVYDYRTPGASRRRSLGRTADGREILMRTKTSARDIERTTSLLERSVNRAR